MHAATVTPSASKSVGNIDLNEMIESHLSFSKSRKQTLNPYMY